MKPWLLALLGVLIAAAAFVADMLLLTSMPAVRNGYWTFALLLPAVGLAVAAVVKQRSWATLGLAVATFAIAGFYTRVRFILAPASPPLLSLNQDFPSFELQDQDGKEVSLRQLRSDGPVIVVLFRGHW
jgi:cytochrome oxidase Cu insertion factor (SCO1/SenC/PrrC family)